jgi:type IX secretion system PorP/SprF family membrane protein
MKKSYIILLMMLCCSSAFSQQEAMYSQYVFNPMAINPAMGSSTNEATTKVIYRKKFMGGDFEGDPQTQTVVVDLPLKNEKMGVGIQLYNDIAGVVKSTGGYGIYYYKAQLNDQLTLSMGVQAGFTNFRANLTSVQLIDPKDPNFGQNINKMLPSVGAGINLSNDKWSLAIAAPQLIRTNLSLVDNPNANYTTTNARFLFSMFSYNFRLNTAVKLMPSILAKMLENVPVAFDYNLKASFNDKFLLGGSYRTAGSKFNEASTQTRLGDAFLAFTEIQISPKLRFGYSYNIPTTKGMYDSGSHEVLLSFRFLKNQEETITDPRFK